MTMIIAIVSPMALPIPRTLPAPIPERAAGIRTCQIVCQCVAPSLANLLYILRGTALRLSSLMLISSVKPWPSKRFRRPGCMNPVPPIWRTAGTITEHAYHAVYYGGNAYQEFHRGRSIAVL
jgi:hypothetical protein